MKKGIVTLCAVLLLFSCKSKQAVLSEEAAAGRRPAQEIIAGHQANFKDFKTLLIKSNVAYEDKHTSQNLNAEIRIKKDEIILVSVRILGFTMAKARITPDEVSYYEKLNGTYFKGSYAVLSRWLGTKLDYNTVQDILLAHAAVNPDINYKPSVEQGQYKLAGDDRMGLYSEFLFEGGSYLLKKEHIVQQGMPQRVLDIQYPAFTEADGHAMPSQIHIDAEQEDRVKIDVDYTSIKFNEQLTFPYDVPGGYDQIFID